MLDETTTYRELSGRLIAKADVNGFTVTVGSDVDNFIEDSDGILQRYLGLVIKISAPHMVRKLTIPVVSSAQSYAKINAALDEAIKEKVKIKPAGLVSCLDNLTLEERTFAELHLISKKSSTLSA